MEKNVLREVEKRLINGFMDFILLLSLNGNGGCFSGYDAIKYIHRRYHFLPSPGTVYSNLYAMERIGWLEGVEKNRRRVYRLTSKGLELARELERVNGNLPKLVARVFSSNRSDFSQQP